MPSLRRSWAALVICLAPTVLGPRTSDSPHGPCCCDRRGLQQPAGRRKAGRRGPIGAAESPGGGPLARPRAPAAPQPARRLSLSLSLSRARAGAPSVWPSRRDGTSGRLYILVCLRNCFSCPYLSMVLRDGTSGRPEAEPPPARARPCARPSAPRAAEPRTGGHGATSGGPEAMLCRANFRPNTLQAIL